MCLLQVGDWFFCCVFFFVYFYVCFAIREKRYTFDVMWVHYQCTFTTLFLPANFIHFSFQIFFTALPRIQECFQHENVLVKECGMLALGALSTGMWFVSYDIFVPCVRGGSLHCTDRLFVYFFSLFCNYFWRDVTGEHLCLIGCVDEMAQYIPQLFPFLLQVIILFPCCCTSVCCYFLYTRLLVNRNISMFFFFIDCISARARSLARDAFHQLLGLISLL